MDKSVKVAGTEGKVGGFFCRLPPLNENTGYGGAGLPVLNQYSARINVSCSSAQGSDAGEVRIHNLLVCLSIYLPIRLNPRGGHQMGIPEY